MNKIRPFLWFDDEAEDAATLYTSIFPNSKITHVARYGDAGPGPKDKAMVVTFELAGQEFMALNFFGQGEEKAPAPAFYVNCKDQEEVDRFWVQLSEGGQPGVCGWLKDRFGVNWNIVPEAFGEMMSDEDDAKTDRVMKAMLGMTKMDIGELERAYAGMP
ncbi:MAG TPA: VOC family protein [Candidatus Baltobacteraceae bacterium]|nr:VOC family protein [Candidatus Baltobacteraceae bacterium]